MAAIRMPNQAKLKEHKAKMNRKLSVEDEEIKSPSRFFADGQRFELCECGRKTCEQDEERCMLCILN